ncbi:hypothetical protein A3G67_00545 [Candidatus Roizmanbacteria bacterium RIFCSPLOWO2_12_FULL_40_12]|uniref:Uncharacterized protein n=1 Tax=Candidatus Roizmanbacteria bacterium RIFCSPLOWO2_01_FULL_40_42 TaxID=1802066 RepID=A0A1F7J667_9BACT|nr:MAG: hypothetical protein A2779_02025 [Candidatus Roizmanbacteria bacterium RIFCSPHIGHO2_01_FULL_40_98]OGK28770.1 MAG: hypothetical protein A3C31_03945 [Candidatus Roizmanbacteria bacterium RIFCSPHIGHO2_02_FULL_40_53]OGK29628.1 MAG: hypothetical protein A2W49_00340 [Candidatus Roizmanbacteria bacterium RIFCSPHIGHO2_12_41_18]OGK36337.1 MAG: hypothetical protein A3E69_02840 [Candidatus Roizmanbacteria bacterium RIFCSPHIGHO2_12_FULL_40_130]OGK51111.1 MAG: hypothetical protein A3B50_04920 [Candi
MVAVQERHGARPPIDLEVVRRPTSPDIDMPFIRVEVQSPEQGMFFSLWFLQRENQWPKFPPSWSLDWNSGRSKRRVIKAFKQLEKRLGAAEKVSYGVPCQRDRIRIEKLPSFRRRLPRDFDYLEAHFADDVSLKWKESNMPPQEKRTLVLSAPIDVPLAGFEDLVESTGIPEKEYALPEVMRAFESVRIQEATHPPTL